MCEKREKTFCILKFLRKITVTIKSKFSRFKICKCKGIPTWILAIFAILTFLITNNNNELVNRPFVSIEDIYWFTQNTPDDNNEIGFSIRAAMENYGNKPAENFIVKNARIIILSVDKENVVRKLGQENLIDSQNQIREDTANFLANYFSKYPYATETNVRDYANSWKLPKNLKYNNRPLVNYIGGNNDMDEYFCKIKSIIYPGHRENEQGYDQPMSKKHLNSITIEGNNFLVFYWIIEYIGQTRNILHFPPFTLKTYSTSYVGYYFPQTPSKEDTKHLREIRSWTKVN